jgi:hypothetical protein
MRRAQRPRWPPAIWCLSPQRSLTCCSVSIDSIDSPSPQPPGEPRGARIDAALASHELLQGLRVRLVHHRVPHDPRPLAAGPLVRLGRVGGAADDGGKAILSIRDFQPLQAQGPASSVDFLALGRPPRNEALDGGQVAIDRVAVPGGLAVSPGIADPLQVAAQGFPARNTGCSRLREIENIDRLGPYVGLPCASRPANQREFPP